jgi:2-oxo-4-hydroxy-4-carboxy--5-ureidoimidazoline (OHCU) decarboxylase
MELASRRDAVEGGQAFTDTTPDAAMDKKTNLTNPVVTAVTRADAAGGPKKSASAAAAAQAAAPAPGLPNFAVLARRVFGNWPLIVVALVIGAPISLKLIKTKAPVFKSEGILIFRGGVNGDPSLETLKALANRMKESSVASSTLKRVIDDLHLSRRATETGDYEAVIAALRPRIDTKPKTPDTFVVTFDAATPDDAQQFTQRLCEVMMDENMKSRQDRAKDSIDFLEAEKKRADDDLGKAEKARTLFMTEHPDFATDGKDGTTIRAEQKANASQRKKAAGNAARVRRAAGAGKATAPGPAPGFGPAPPVAAGAPAVDPVLVAARNQARGEVAAARKQLADKSVNLTEQHPDVRAAAARLAAAESSLEQAEAAIAAAQPSEPAPGPSPAAAAFTGGDPYEEPSAAPKAGAAPIAAAAGDPAADKPKPKPRLVNEDGEPIVVEIEAEWSHINRDVGEARSRRGQLEARLFTAEISANSEVSGYGSTMIMPEPATRATAAAGLNPKLLRAAGMGGALVVGLLLAAIRGILFDDRLFDASEIDGLGLAPLLGSVPKVKVEKKKKRSLLGRLRG